MKSSLFGSFVAAVLGITALGMTIDSLTAFAQAPAKKAAAEKLAVPTEMAVIALNAKTGYAQLKELKLPSTTAANSSCKLKAGAKITLLGAGTKEGTFKFRNDTAGGTGYCPYHTQFELVAKVVEELRTAAASAPQKK